VKTSKRFKWTQQKISINFEHWGTNLNFLSVWSRSHDKPACRPIFPSDQRFTKQPLRYLSERNSEFHNHPRVAIFLLDLPRGGIWICRDMRPFRSRLSLSSTLAEISWKEMTFFTQK
jgi:hypothetical protein